MAAPTGERTSAMEDEGIIRRVPHVAEDSAERGPARVENLGIQLHERLRGSTGRRQVEEPGREPHLRFSTCIKLKTSTKDTVLVGLAWLDGLAETLTGPCALGCSPLSQKPEYAIRLLRQFGGLLHRTLQFPCLSGGRIWW